jgi:uncharacterized protein (UPF0332 family)
MSWNALLDKREVVPHTTSAQELNNLRALIARDLADAAIAALSPDRRFATAYNAALHCGTIVVACSGYRVSARAGHHAVTFEAAQLAIGASASPFIDYFDACRRKRNTIDYQNTSVATATEAVEIQRKATEFLLLVETWVKTQHPAFSK